jgi:hypothetical protein
MTCSCLQMHVPLLTSQICTDRAMPERGLQLEGIWAHMHVRQCSTSGQRDICSVTRPPHLYGDAQRKVLRAVFVSARG